MGKKRKVPLYIWAGGAIVVLFGLFLLFNSRPSEAKTTSNVPITEFKTPTCGCCAIYADYLGAKGDMEVTVETRGDLAPLKSQYKIPPQLQSCHTAVVAGYFVEGHIPLEAIEKLLAEKPDIAGISMPGMPRGSPGMPGAKAGPFVVYAVSKDGTVQEFMRV